MLSFSCDNEDDDDGIHLRLLDSSPAIILEPPEGIGRARLRIEYAVLILSSRTSSSLQSRFIMN